MSRPRVLAEADRIAGRRHARHQLGGWLGRPSRHAHRQADRWLAALDALDDTPADTAITWGKETTMGTMREDRAGRQPERRRGCGLRRVGAVLDELERTPGTLVSRAAWPAGMGRWVSGAKGQD